MDDLVEESQHIESDYDAWSKAEEDEQLRTQAEQEVAGLGTEEEERLRVDAEEKNDQWASRLDLDLNVCALKHRKDSLDLMPKRWSVNRLHIRS